MSSRSQRPVSQRSSTTIFYTLAIGSGVLRALSVVFDIVAINTIDIHPLVYGILAQWVSLLVTVLLVGIVSIHRTVNGRKQSLGYNLDPDFDRLRILPKKPMLYLVASGFFAAISTLSYYILVGASDASAVLPYGQLVIIYLLMGDLLAEKDTPTIIEVQSVVSILFGVLLIGATPGGFDVPSLLLVLGPMNISSAFVTYYQRKTKRYEIRPGLKVDSLNMRVWSLLVLNSVMSLLVLPLIPADSLQVMIDNFIPLLWLMIGSSLTIFLALVMYARALGRGSMSVVNSLSAISVVLGVPITLIGNALLPGAFGIIETDPFMWTLTILGIVLVMIGIVALQAADVYSFVIITVKPLVGDILPELFDIKGVEKAAALAGTHDYMLTIKSRNLAKTRTMILNRIQKIPGIEDIETLVVIREYR
ncbi:MAG: Lrp/AsnC ligand binding domain-containing protein [Candidatus Thorarchaeota archaeon]|nr:Lrp/AsnC ligand binding domain-containing protein [Candidatus Thorarchaeota archaeon]